MRLIKHILSHFYKNVSKIDAPRITRYNIDDVLSAPPILVQFKVYK